MIGVEREIGALYVLVGIRNAPISACVRSAIIVIPLLSTFSINLFVVVLSRRCVSILACGPCVWAILGSAGSAVTDSALSTSNRHWSNLTTSPEVWD
jgi:hypothetical protein